MTVTLEVTDSDGATASDTVEIDAGNARPTATIAAPAADLAWRVGDTIAFSGSASDPDETLGAGALTWALRLHHCSSSLCHVHEVQELPGVASGSFLAPNHAYPSYLELVLTAKDSHGGTATDSVELHPTTVQLTFATSPPGLRLVVDGEEVAPFTRRLIVGSTATVTAPSPQAASGTTFSFSAWSNGGARSHELVAPGSPATYTATFTAPPNPPAPPMPPPSPPAQPPAPKLPTAKRCIVPKVLNKTLVRARRALTASHCTAGRITRAYSRKVRAGLVLAQSPRARTKLANRAKVKLVISRGRRR